MVNITQNMHPHTCWLLGPAEKKLITIMMTSNVCDGGSDNDEGALVVAASASVCATLVVVYLASILATFNDPHFQQLFFFALRNVNISCFSVCFW